MTEQNATAIEAGDDGQALKDLRPSGYPFGDRRRTTEIAVTQECSDAEARGIILDLTDLDPAEHITRGGRVRMFAGSGMTRGMAAASALNALRFHRDHGNGSRDPARIAKQSLLGWGSGRDVIAAALVEHVELDAHRPVPCGCGRHGYPSIGGGAPDPGEGRSAPLHRCADGCGWLVRRGEPHVCAPRCACRPRDLPQGLADAFGFQHRDGCPHNGRTPHPHDCERCPDAVTMRDAREERARQREERMAIDAETLEDDERERERDEHERYSSGAPIGGGAPLEARNRRP